MSAWSRATVKGATSSYRPRVSKPILHAHMMALVRRRFGPDRSAAHHHARAVDILVARRRANLR